MIKISANVSKKVPVPNVQFSSQQFGATVEIELSDADRADAIKKRLTELYELLLGSVDDQIRAASEAASGVIQAQLWATQDCASLLPGEFHNASPVVSCTGQRHKQCPSATRSQKRALYEICRSFNLDLAEILADHDVATVNQLTIHDASKLIDELKRKNGEATPTFE